MSLIDMLKSLLLAIIGAYFGLLGFMSAVYGVAVTFLNGFYKVEYKNDNEVREKLKKS